MKTWTRSRVARHGLYWVAVSAFFVGIALPEYLLANGLLYWREYFFAQLPLMLLGTYPLVYGLLPHLLSPRRRARHWALLAGWLVGSELLAGVLRAFYTYVITPRLFHESAPPFTWAEVFGTVRFGYLALLVVAFGACGAKLLHSWHEQQQLNQQLQQRKLHTELQLLKAQLQPIFLFNTLRTLRELTEQKSPDSPTAVLQLSALLRYMLYESPLDAVPLADEVEMMQHYVALEKLRLGNHVDVSLNFSGAFGAHTIAPLLLLPFVENAFRHGTAAPAECPWISIDLVVKRNSLTFKVINSHRGGELTEPEGSGLQVIRQRLARLYSGQHQLKIVTDPDSFLIALDLRLAPAPSSALGTDTATRPAQLSTTNR